MENLEKNQTPLTQANDFWKAYQEKGVGRPPREQLVKFLNQHGKEISTAIELGCGPLADTTYIASQGIKVTGVDSRIDLTLKNNILNNSSQTIKDNLTTQVQNFENLNLEKADLIYSFASLPFCSKENFGNMISNIVQSVNPNGYVAAHFFQTNHPFTMNGGKATGFSPEQIETLFNYLGFETQIETWKTDKTQDGRMLENMNNIFVTAKAPEQLPNYSVEEINNILGLNAVQTFNTETNATDSTQSTEIITNDVDTTSTETNSVFNEVVNHIKETHSVQPLETPEIPTDFPPEA